MKIISAIILSFALTGCAVVEKVTDLWPRDHDPVLVGSYINLQKSLEQADCKDQLTISNSIVLADFVNRYAQFRNDPQKDATKSIYENLVKAGGSSESACVRWMNIVNIKMKIVGNSWSNR